MIKIIIFFIFSLIMLKISWADIEDEPQPLTALAVSRSPEQSYKLTIIYAFQELMRFFRFHVPFPDSLRWILPLMKK